MKIFNWVQKRFNHGSLQDGLTRNARRTELFPSEADKQALLEQVALEDVLEGWEDSILTIGTLGFEPAKPSYQKTGYIILESEAEKQVGGGDEDIDEEEEQELHFSVEYENDNIDNYYEDDQISLEDDEEEVNPLIYSSTKKPSVTIEVLEDGVDTEPMGINSINVPEDCDQRKMKGERVTLAELFLAETDMGKEKEYLGVIDQPHLPGKKQVLRSKNGLSFAKKLIPYSRQDSRPIKKLNRLMRKILKRKIHPELEGKECKMSDGDQNKLNMEEARINKGIDSGDSMFLLPTPSDLQVVPF